MPKNLIVRLVLAAALAWATLLSAGCSSIAMKMPTNRFDSPEARGGLFKFYIDPLILEGNSEFTLVQNYTQAPPPVNSPSFNTSNFDYALAAGMGLLDRLDVTFKGPSTSPNQLGLKYQLIGDTQASSGIGNFSMAVTLAGGYNTDGGSASELFSGQDASYSLHDWMWDTSIVFGLRLLPQLLIYTGPFYSQYTITGTINQPSGSNVNYGFGGLSRQYGYSVGYELSLDILELKFDLAWAHAWAGTQALTAFYPGFLVGFRF